MEGTTMITGNAIIDFILSVGAILAVYAIFSIPILKQAKKEDEWIDELMKRLAEYDNLDGVVKANAKPMKEVIH